VGRKKHIKDGVKDFIAKYGPAAIASLRLAYDVVRDWVGRQ
jgi:hypothetical protein